MSDTVKPERRQRVRKEQPTTFELRAVFHRLWGSQVGSPEYKKRDWQELQKILFRLFKVEV
jgi:hypothetical protein